METPDENAPNGAPGFEYIPPSGTDPYHRSNYVSSGRSAIPRVIGILAIIFASLGFLFSLSKSAAPISQVERFGLGWSDLGAFGTWVIVSLILSIIVFGIHLTAGILCVTYKRLAPRFMTLYGILALLSIIADMVISWATFVTISDMFESGGLVGPRIIFGVFGIPWPIIALVMMNVKAARQSCGQMDPYQTQQLFH